MTNREFYTAILSADVSAEIKAFAKEAIEKMDDRNATRATKPSKAAVANSKLAPLMAAAMEQGKQYTASELAVLMGFKTEADKPNTSKATVIAKMLVEDGRAVVAEVKIPKKGKCLAYSLVASEKE